MSGEIGEAGLPDNVRMNLCPARSLVIAFTGLNPAVEFEYGSLLRRSDSATILVRDPLSTWYHGPVISDQWGCAPLADFLAEKAALYDQVVCIGSSMGGYAALMFGKLIGAHQIIAFSPQTLVDPEILRQLDDPRYLQWLDEVAARSPDRAFFECSGIESQRVDQKIDVFVSKRDPFDHLHADRLIGSGGVRIHRLESLQHTLIGPLRAFGTLRRLIASACAGSPLPDVETEVAREVALRDHTLRLAEPIRSDRYLKQIKIKIAVEFLYPRGDPKLLCRLYRRPEDSPLLAWQVESHLDGEKSHFFLVTFSYDMLPIGNYELELLLWEGGFYYDQFGSSPLRVRFETEAEPSISLMSIVDGHHRPIQRHMQPSREILWDVAPEDRWVRRFFPAVGELKSAIGHFDNGRLLIRTEGGGCALYGPYAALPAGGFVARVIFTHEGVIGAGSIDVMSGIGQRMLAERRIKPEEISTKGFAEISWESEQPLQNVEIRLICDAGFVGNILRLEIERLGDCRPAAEVREQA